MSRSKDTIRQVAIKHLLDEVRAMRNADEEGGTAFHREEEEGYSPDLRSSDSWYKESYEHLQRIYDLIDEIDGTPR